MRITPEYLNLQKQLHQTSPDYGTSGHKHADRILSLCQKLQTKDVLDYGCGKQTLQKSLPFPIQNYDPAIAGLDSEPSRADIVVCSDVLEHVESGCVPDVLGHLRALTGKALFLDVATRPAKKVLADGRNAHITQWHHVRWLKEICEYVDPVSFQTYTGGFVMICIPYPTPDEGV